MKNKLVLFNLNRLGKPIPGIFISRQNRFVGEIIVNGQPRSCHIADTGRLKEILIRGREILVCENPPRLKTDYRLIACKMEEWVLINTAIHTHIARSAIQNGVLGFIPKTLQPEVKCGKSRLDFLVDNHLFIELKGTNLVSDSKCLFPDAPTERGCRHLEALIRLKQEGFDSMILVLGLRNCNCFVPNREMDPTFSGLFQNALNSGVKYRGFRVKLDVPSGHIFPNGELPLCPEFSND